MAPAPRKAPPTHPTVWIGLGLAAIGLLLAMFAYSGTRVYDIVYAIVAVVGAILALAGILIAAWGRAVMSARAQRARRGTMQADTLKLREALGPPPTVAEPPSKRRLDVRGMVSRLGSGRRAAASGTTTVVVTEPTPDVATPTAPSPPPAAPAEETFHLECPSCATKFVTSGRRPFVATCPVCRHAETLE